MGNGKWSDDTYHAAATYRAATGTSAFAYSDSGATQTHPDLDPKGVVVRESRDSDEHPNAVPIAVLFDVTGSMGTVPRLLQEQLPQLFGLLLRKGYVTDPQILFGAIGDATCDAAPLQIGQFESDNRLDENLGKIYIERGGGGQKTESYELALYFMARHTAHDRYEKRGEKGYLFIIGDEMPYPQVFPRASYGVRAGVEEVIGDALAAPLSTEAILAEAQERYHVYYVQPGAGSQYVNDAEVNNRWRDLLGQNYLRVDVPEAVCETIALAIGLAEGTVDLAQGLRDLKDVGSRAGTSVSKALADVASV